MTVLGFDYAKASVNGRKMTGINSMKEKASFLGGTFKIRSQPGERTLLFF
jgi:signal transduction histidine kinase